MFPAYHLITCPLCGPTSIILVKMIELANNTAKYSPFILKFRQGKLNTKIQIQQHIWVSSGIFYRKTSNIYLYTCEKSIHVRYFALGSGNYSFVKVDKMD